MVYFRVDDGLPGHPKTIELLSEGATGAKAIGLWTLAGAYCGRYLTDGKITSVQLQSLLIPGWKTCATLLVKHGFWIESEPKVFQFVDWNHRNETKAEVKERREKQREKKKRQRAPDALSPGDSPGDSFDPESEDSRYMVKGKVNGSGINRGVSGLTWQRVGALYRERYLKAKEGRVLDYPISAKADVWESVVGLVRDYADPEAAVCKALDGFFADQWVIDNAYPEGDIYKRFGRYYDPPPPKSKSREDRAEAEAERKRKAQDRESQRALSTVQGHELDKAPPPESLGAMLARIGKVVS